LQRRIGQARQIAGLIDEHLRLVLKRGDLVGDLLELRAAVSTFCA
jgi:hypothetical protein